MRPSLFPSDDSLPTWLHTLLCIIVVAPFAGFLLRFGFAALFTAHLNPLPGPDIGQYFFGNKTLIGSSARLAGVSLLFLGIACITLGLSFTRPGQDYPRLRQAPWVLLAMGVLLMFWIS